MRRNCRVDETTPDRTTLLTGHCDHCDWHAIEGSYAALVETYHDHLRETHPAAWVRA